LGDVDVQDEVRHFHVAVDAAAPGAALVRAFLWLKRRAEEANANGVLAIPDFAYLRGPLSDALGWRLTTVFESEGRLPLGDRIAIYCRWRGRGPKTFGPVASVLPAVSRLTTLARLAGPTLIVSDSPPVLESWQQLTDSRVPPPEDYSRPLVLESSAAGQGRHR
jgi:hypothetical protein